MSTPLTPSVGLHFEPFHPRTSPTELLVALAALYEVGREERDPHDPPLRTEDLLSEWRHLPELIDVSGWLVRDADRVVARGAAHLRRDGSNAHMAGADLYVHPEYRRRGLGRALLQRVADTAGRDGRRLLLSSTTDRAPGGGEFARRVGAQAGLEMHTNQLVLADLDRGLLRDWTERGAAGGAYTLGFWEGPYPEDQLARIARLWEVMNTAPRGTLDMEDEVITEEMVRQWDASLWQSGERRLSAWVRQDATGELAGFTELFWRPSRSQLLFQGATGVWPHHRGRGLGRWLKAANLRRALELVPEARVVRTGNADSNAAMLSINRALGFTPYKAVTEWQLPLESARAYLAGRS